MPMTDCDVLAYLGDTYGETTPDQRDRISQAADAIDARWPDPDLSDIREAALSAAAQIILGDSSESEVVGAWRATVVAEMHARAAVTGAVVVALQTASETAVAGRLGLARDTVRRAAGKGR